MGLGFRLTSAWRLKIEDVFATHSARAWNSGRAWPGEYGCSARTYTCQCCALIRTPSALGLLRCALELRVFGCFERVVSYVGLRQHSRVSKLHDTCRNKWRRWCAGRVNCNQVCRALSMRPSHLAQQKRHRPTECGHRLKALGAPTMCAFAGKSLPDASPRCAPDLVPSILAPTCRHPQ